MKKHFLSFILLALTLGWSANSWSTTTIYIKRADATNLVIQYDSNDGWRDYYNDPSKVVKQCDAGWFMYTTSDQMTNAIHIRRKNNEKDWNLSNDRSNISGKTTYWILNDNGNTDYTQSSADQYNTDCNSGGGGDEPTKYYINSKWEKDSDWSWQKMSSSDKGETWTYTHDCYGDGVNINTSESDSGATWFPITAITSDEFKTGDNVTFTYTVSSKTVSARKNSNPCANCKTITK